MITTEITLKCDAAKEGVAQLPAALGWRAQVFRGAPILLVPLKICGVNFTTGTVFCPSKVHIGFIVVPLRMIGTIIVV